MKPKARLPNGKTNPEYAKWYRSTEKGKAIVLDYNHSDAAKNAQKKYRQNLHSSIRARVKKRIKKSFNNTDPRLNKCSDSEDFDPMKKSHLRLFDERGLIKFVSMDEHFDRYGNLGFSDSEWVAEFYEQVKQYDQKSQMVHTLKQ